MPWEFQFDKKLNTVFFQASGEFTNTDLINCQDYCQSNPLYDCTMNQLNDFSAVTRFRITPVGIWRVIHGRKGRGGGRMAVVMASNLGFGLGRMFEMMQDGSPFKIHIFRQRADALHWLGLEPEQCPWNEFHEDAV